RTAPDMTASGGAPMERSENLTAMGELKLYGMKAAYDEIIATAVKRQHDPARVVGDLLTAEINEKQARSIRYQIAIAKLPLAKDVADFKFGDTPINETLGSRHRTDAGFTLSGTEGERDRGLNPNGPDPRGDGLRTRRGRRPKHPNSVVR